MSDFADQLMIRYLTPANLQLLLVPAADANLDRVRSLLASVYDMRFLKVEEVDSIEVRSKFYQVPLVQPVDVRGSWEKVLPNTERTTALFTVPALEQTDWIDMELETKISVKVSITSAALDMISSEDVSELTQAAFVAKFAFLNLNDLMRSVGVSTFPELKADFPRLYHLHYSQPPQYDPNDPSVIRTYPIRVSVLFFPTLDLQGALRQLNTGRDALNSIRPHPEGFEGGDMLSSSAWMGVFPDSAFGAAVTPITKAQVTSLFAADRLVAAFDTP